MQSIKTALPLPIPGFESDHSNQLLTPIPTPPPIHCDLNTDHKDSSVSHTPSVEDVDIDTTYNVVFSAEMDPLEQLLSSYVDGVDWHRVESAYEALESQLNTSTGQDNESQASASPFNQSLLNIQTNRNTGLFLVVFLMKFKRIAQQSEERVLFKKNQYWIQLFRNGSHLMSYYQPKLLIQQ